MSIGRMELAKIVANAEIGKTMTIGKYRLLVHKKVQDKYGVLYTLSLMDNIDKVLRRSPVYIRKPNYRRLVTEPLTMMLLIGLAVSSVLVAAVFLTDLGDIIVIQDSCNISAFEVISTGPNLGFMRITVQNHSDLDVVGVRIKDSLGQIKFDDGDPLTPPQIPPLTESEYKLPNGVYPDGLSAHGTADIGERIGGSAVRQGESILLQAEIEYNVAPPNNKLTCIAEATVR